MGETTATQQILLSKLARYGYAVGAGALASSAAAAVPPKAHPLPVDGLPITIDTSVLIDAPLLIDIDGNGEDDYEIYYSVQYGGGFALTYVAPISAVGFPQVQYHWQYISPNGAYIAARNDLTEYVTVNNEYENQQYYSFISRPVFLDRSAFETLPAYRPFRDNPGFLGLALGTANYSTLHAATLKISVNSNSTQLTIHSGWYRQDEYDIYLDDGVLSKDGFEAYPQSDYFPPVDLLNLANGDAGASHD